MCEPARKLIRLTALTECTMSNRKACNEFTRPSFHGMKLTPTMYLVLKTQRKINLEELFGQIRPFFWLFFM